MKKQFRHLGRKVMMEIYIGKVMWRAIDMEDGELERSLQLAIDNATMLYIQAEINDDKKAKANYKFIKETMIKAKNRLV